MADDLKKFQQLVQSFDTMLRDAPLQHLDAVSNADSLVLKTAIYYRDACLRFTEDPVVSNMS